MNAKRILITGGGGFVGKHLTSLLQSKGYEVIAPSRGQFDLHWPLKDLPRFLAIDHVIHCAGKTFVPDSWKDPLSFMEVNAMGTAKVLELCREMKVGMTYVSAYIYGAPKALPISENTPVNPNNPYAFSKWMAEEQCRFYQRTFDVPVGIIRPFNIYGPGQPSHFLLPTIVEQIRNGKEIRLMDLRPKRDYIHIEDLCQLILQMVETKFSGVLNGASGVSYSVAEVVEILQNLMGTDLPVYSEKIERKNEIDDTRADISNAKRELSWVPNIHFADGIKSLL